MFPAITLASSPKPADDFSWLRGANYVPSYSRNDVQTWMDCDPSVVDRELAYAARLKLNCVRVFLQVAVYEHDPTRFLENFESLLSLCEKHRIQMWDVMNEPYVTSFNTEADRKTIHTFLGQALEMVRRQQPRQPLTIGWEGWALAVDPKQYADKVDVIAFHNYTPELRQAVRSAQTGAAKLGKPVIINEVVGRPHQSFQLAMPILREEKIGWCFWELMLARTQFSRDDPPYQGLIYPDGQSYDTAEVAQVMNVSNEEATKLFPQRRWTREQAWAWYKEQPWIAGFNYVPSTAANTTEFWSKETFDPQTIDRELGWAAKLGFNSCRVFVQYLVWRNDPDGLKKRIDGFLSLAGQHGLSTTLVLFDDCAFGDPPQTEPYLGKQRDPIPGMIAPSWTPSPGLTAVTDRGVWPDLERYVKDIVGTFGHDPRVLLWDLYNEPGNSGMGNKSLPLVEATFAWARAMRPAQPLTMGPFGGPVELSRRQLELSDVISFHFYGDYEGLRGQIASYKKQLRPVINTEWMARLQGSKWETDLPLFKQEAVGCYSWGLVNGRTQCQFAWYHKAGTPEPKVWFHDLFHRDGRPYDPAEHEVIRRTTASKGIDWAAADYSKLQTKPGLAAHIEDGIKFSDGWTRWTGIGPRKERLHYAKEAGATATWEAKGGPVTLIHKVGPDCGIALVLVDGEPAPRAEIDTYSPTVDWGRPTLLATNLPPGRHTITIVTLGKKNEKSSDSYVQIVDVEKSP